MQFALMGLIFLMSFLGSWHCGVMCGPLSCNFKVRQDFFSYHIGRLISYLLMGAVLFFGTHYFINTESRNLKLAASMIFGLIFIIFGLIQLNIFKHNRLIFKYYKIQFKIIEANKDLANKFPIILGLLTGLFPCTWLYSFLLLSTQMKSLTESLLVIFIFWVSALPAFVVFTGFMQNLIKSSPVSYQKISGFILIAAGLFSIIGHWAEI